MPVGIIPMLRHGAQLDRVGVNVIVSMPIGIIPMLRLQRQSPGLRYLFPVSMPIGIIPMLRRLAGRHAVLAAVGFNAYRHYPYVETQLLRRRYWRPYPGFNAYRHYPYVETMIPAAAVEVFPPSFNAYRHYPYVETSQGHRWCSLLLSVSMPIGIIPMLRPHHHYRERVRPYCFNAYRHYPYVETGWLYVKRAQLYWFQCLSALSLC